MRKGTPQVAKSASKVAKKGARWAHFGIAGLPFDASLAIFGVPWRFLRTFKRFFCLFM